jgi:hypothetical protein
MAAATTAAYNGVFRDQGFTGTDPVAYPEDYAGQARTGFSLNMLDANERGYIGMKFVGKTVSFMNIWLTDIDLGYKSIYGVDLNGQSWKCTNTTTLAWTKVAPPAEGLSRIAANSTCPQVWALGRTPHPTGFQMYHMNAAKTGWIKVTGILNSIDVDMNCDVVGTNLVGDIWKLKGGKYPGGSWDHIPAAHGGFEDVAIDNGRMYALTREDTGHLYNRKVRKFRNSTKTWTEPLPGLMTRISVDKQGMLWSSNGDRRVFHFLDGEPN